MFFRIRSKSSQNVNGKGYRYRESERRQNEMKIIIADTTAGKVIGRKGETVKKIQEVCSADPDATFIQIFIEIIFIVNLGT